MGDLAVDTAVAGGDGRYTAKLSVDWEIWGPMGGYVAAIALRAAGAHSPFTRPASFFCHYLAVGAFESVDVHVTTLRRTKRAESMRVSMTQGDRPILEATAWVVADGLDGVQHDDARLTGVPGPHELPGIEHYLTPEQLEAGPPYAFWNNLDAKPVHWIDNWDNREAGDPVFQEWLRFRPTATFDDPFLDAARQLILLDVCQWPAASNAHAARDLRHMAPSLDVYAVFHRMAPDAEWLLCDGYSPYSGDGLVGGTARVWDSEGRLLASGAQQMLCRSMPTPR